MEKNKTEGVVSQINSNVFFKEFTYSKNDFKDLDSNQELEFADNVVWLDDLLFVFQIKDRNPNETLNDNNWFNSKVLRKAVRQIKNTNKYLNSFNQIEIINEKGHKKNIVEAKEARIYNVIVYTPSDDFLEERRQQKFYESKEVGLIHLFHSEDYYWICRYLLTPAEIEEYLFFREELYIKHKILNQLPEQYVLGHFLETLNVDEINPKYIENLKVINDELLDFNISYLIENFDNHIKPTIEQTEYYYVIAEIAKLNRAELTEFKKRFILTLEKCKDKEFTIPYRVHIPRTDCSFVFIPIHKSKSKHWNNALYNLTMAQKYDQKASKCVGVVVFEKIVNRKVYFDMYWNLIDFEWVYDEVIENLLKDNYPFREAKLTQLQNRYKN